MTETHAGHHGHHDDHGGQGGGQTAALLGPARRCGGHRSALGRPSHVGRHAGTGGTARTGTPARLGRWGPGAGGGGRCARPQCRLLPGRGVLGGRHRHGRSRSSPHRGQGDGRPIAGAAVGPVRIGRRPRRTGVDGVGPGRRRGVHRCRGVPVLTHLLPPSASASFRGRSTPMAANLTTPLEARGVRTPSTHHTKIVNSREPPGCQASTAAWDQSGSSSRSGSSTASRATAGRAHFLQAPSGSAATGKAAGRGSQRVICNH